MITTPQTRGSTDGGEEQPSDDPVTATSGVITPGSVSETAASAPAVDPAEAPSSRSGARRVIELVAAGLAILLGSAAVAVGAVALIFDRTQRDATGYLSTLPSEYMTSTYAIVSDSYRTGVTGDVLVPRAMLGTIRIRARSAQPVFVGIGPAAAVDAYIGGVQREVAARFDGKRGDVRVYPGGAPTAPPTAQHFWVARSLGSGTQTLYWSPRNGNWRIVVMNANGSADVSAELAFGARFPHLLSIGTAVLAGGLLLLVLGGAGIRAGGSRRRGGLLGR